MPWFVLFFFCERCPSKPAYIPCRVWNMSIWWDLHVSMAPLSLWREVCECSLLGMYSLPCICLPRCFGEWGMSMAGLWLFALVLSIGISILGFLVCRTLWVISLWYCLIENWWRGECSVILVNNVTCVSWFVLLVLCPSSLRACAPLSLVLGLCVFGFRRIYFGHLQEAPCKTH